MTYTKSFFTPKEVCKLVGLSYRQIQYWDKTHFIKPSYKRRGKYRLYTFSDVMRLDLTAKLRDSGRSIQELRGTIKTINELLPQLSFPFVDMKIIVDKKGVMMFNGDVLTNSYNNFFKYDVRNLKKTIDNIFTD